MGVPTMDALIIASGLQKPRSVILPRFTSSSWRENGELGRLQLEGARAISRVFFLYENVLEFDIAMD